MNIVRELRIKKGLQQKELALELGISNAAVSNWEHGKSDPSGDRLKKLAEFFDVDESFILGYGLEKPNLFVPVNPKISGISETEQIVNYVLEKLNVQQAKDESEIKTPEARILAQGIDKLPKEQREQAVNVFRAMFSPQYSNLFTKGDGE